MDSNSVLKIFKEITFVPRESGHEGPMTAWLQKFAADHSLECKTDKTGNVLIVKEAAPGKENVPALVLQAHQDMVCEKNAGFEFDFLTQAPMFTTALKADSNPSSGGSGVTGSVVGSLVGSAGFSLPHSLVRGSLEHPAMANRQSAIAACR